MKISQWESLHCRCFQSYFQYLTLDICNRIDQGKKFPIRVRDYTDDSNFVKHMYLQGKQSSSCYVFGWKDLIRRWNPNVGDQVGLRWDD